MPPVLAHAFPCAVPDTAEPAIGRLVQLGLGSSLKSLPSSLLYDERGSSLFLEITQQPEYQLTNWEIALLQTHARDIASLFGPGFTRFYEFGAGCFSAKQEAILDALRDAGTKVIYCPIDICRESVDHVAQAVRQRYHRPIAVEPIAAEYEDALMQIMRKRMRDGRPQFFFLPGANIGNFSDSEAIAFMRSVARLMGSNDHLMIGFDLVKDIPQMVAAYDDAAGVTRAFNLNLLTRLNRECGADFDQEAFAHHPYYDTAERAMKSEIVSLKEQVVAFSQMPGFFVPFKEGEVIAIERSRKYNGREINTMARQVGLSVFTTFTNGLYADVVFKRAR